MGHHREHQDRGGERGADDAASGNPTPRAVTSGQAPNGRGELRLARRRSRITASCAEGERGQDSEGVRDSPGTSLAIAVDPASTIVRSPRHGDGADRLAGHDRSPLEAARVHGVAIPCVGDGVGERGYPRHRGRVAPTRMRRRRDSHCDPERVDEDAGSSAVERGGDPDERQPRGRCPTELGRSVGPG